jgi:uncharacterized membrane protein HdeD (DUF308 family)
MSDNPYQPPIEAGTPRKRRRRTAWPILVVSALASVVFGVVFLVAPSLSRLPVLGVAALCALLCGLAALQLFDRPKRRAS